MSAQAWVWLVCLVTASTLWIETAGQCTISSCTACDDPAVTCDACITGYIQSYDNSSCLACPDHCSVCTDTNRDRITECTTCDSRFFLKDGQCEYCPGNCLACGGAYDCMECRSRYHLLQGDSCIACTGGCAVCADGDLDSCYQCKDGFYLQTNSATSLSGQCVACASGCETCVSGISCTRCETGKTWNSVYMMCEDCIDHCDNTYCSTDDGCTQCEEGYFLSPEGDICRECTHCESGSCLNGQGCVECLTGYIRNDDLTCHECPDIDGDSVLCLMCGDDERGRYHVEGECLYCDDNCAVCGSDTVCIECISGYFLNNVDSCTACHDDCMECEDGATAAHCTACYPGDRLVDRQCHECSADNFVDNCATCTTDTCTACEHAFSLYTLHIDDNDDNPTNQCRGCPVNTTDLTLSSTVCSTCGGTTSRGMFLTSEPCQDCPDNCLACTSTGMCTQCSTSHYIKEADGTCGALADFPNPYPAACKIYNEVISGSNIASLECNQCLDDYYFNGADCVIDNNAGVPVVNNSACLIYSVFDTDLDGGITCLRCEDNKVWDYSTGYDGDCVADDPDAHCEVWHVPQQDGVEPVCLLCDPEYYIVTESNRIGDQPIGECAQRTENLANCYRYSDPAVCEECVAGYFLDPDNNNCIGCGHVSRHDTSYICTQCSGQAGTSDHSSVQSWQGECQACPTFCVTCTAATSCTQCREDTYWDADTLQCAPIQCATLADIDTSEHCLACKDRNIAKNSEHRGLAFIAYSCVECGRNCEVCHGSTSSCTQCRAGYVWNANDQMCVQCLYETISTCTGCVNQNTQGHYYDPVDVACYQCEDNCVSCNADACTECAADFYLDGDGNCISCTQSSYTEESCSKCNDKSFFTPPRYWIADTDGNLDCRSCPQDCQDCSTAQSCSQCEGYRYFDVDSNSCQDCLTNCEICTSASECTKCQHGYTYTVEERCDPCPDNCQTCTHADACTACIDNYYLDASKQCTLCSSSISNCKLCTSTTSEAGALTVTCNECYNTYYPNTDTGLCDVCTDGCDTCTTSTGCSACSTGYCYDEDSSVCRYVPTGYHCDTCHLKDGVVACLTCTSGFYRELCTRCDNSYCLSCDQSASLCTSCNTGSYLDTNAHDCVACIDGCSTCRDATTCEACDTSKYYDSDDQMCKSCPSRCYACHKDTNGVICDTCMDTNMYKNEREQTCHYCIPNCQTCTQGDTCTGCNTGYRPRLNIEGTAVIDCTVCPTGCATCALQSDGVTVTCDTCLQNAMKLPDDTCLPCDAGFGGCATCQSVNHDTVVDANECDSCDADSYRSPDRSSCNACSITNCATCVDNPETCTVCGDNQLPTRGGLACGQSCYVCSGAGCEDLTATNATEKTGCTNGCWVSRNKTEENEHWQRGCNDDHLDFSCTSYETEMCMGEENSEGQYCARCCSDSDLCNTYGIEASSAHDTKPSAVALLLLATQATVITLIGHIHVLS